MQKPGFLLLLAILGGGGYWFLQNFEVARHGEGIQITPKQASNTPAQPSADENGSLAARLTDRISIAAFNMQVFGDSKSKKTHVMEILARIVRQYDIVAVQEIRSKNQDILPNFIDRINASGRYYEYVIGERLGRSSSKEQYAFIFDAETIEIDRNQLYTINDPDDLLHREPLVGWFRVRGPPADQAFTFSLVNIHTDPDEAGQELNALDDVFLAVRNDGRGEDDVIVLGDLNADYRHLGELGELPEIACAIMGHETNTRKTQSYDNIIFDAKATTEFTGRSGVDDFMRAYNLSQQEALEVSDHMPVWAEFTIYEGGRLGTVASQPKDSTTN